MIWTSNKSKPAKVTKTTDKWEVEEKYYYNDKNGNWKYDEWERVYKSSEAEYITYWYDDKNNNGKMDKWEATKTTWDLFLDKYDWSPDNIDALNLSKYSKDILDSFVEARKTWKKVIDVLWNKYKNKSEDEKIKLMMTVWEQMNKKYNDKMWEKRDGADVSEEKMWNSLVTNTLWWVCRHIHSEVAKLWEKMWMNMWVITTNSWGRHAITLWRKKDGTWFFIDYGTYYESKNFMDLKDRYLAWKWSLDLKEWVWDPDWKTIKYIQTALEKELSNTVSSTWNEDSSEVATAISKNWRQITDWVSTKLHSTKRSKEFEIKKWNWRNHELWLFAKEKKWIWLADYSSYWALMKWKWWDPNSTFWQFWAWVKFSVNNIKWYNWNKKTLYGIWADLSHYKILHKDQENKFSIWTVIQWQFILDKFNKKGVQDSNLNFYSNLNWQHKFNEHWTWELNVWAGADVSVENIRYEKLKLFWVYGISWQLAYKNWKLEIVWWWGERWSLWTKQKKVHISVKYGKLKLYWKYKITKDTSKFNFSPQIEKELRLEYDVTKALKLTASYKDKNNMWQKSTRAYIWFKLKI